jgi:hypothetical protein
LNPVSTRDRSTRHRVEPSWRDIARLSCATAQLCCIFSLLLPLSCLRSISLLTPTYNTPWQSTTPAELPRRSHWTRQPPRIPSSAARRLLRLARPAYFFGKFANQSIGQRATVHNMSTTSELRRAARIILIGAPGVGKGTQTTRMLKRFPQLAAISSGDLLRDNVRNRTPLGMCDMPTTLSALRG